MPSKVPKRTAPSSANFEFINSVSNLTRSPRNWNHNLCSVCLLLTYGYSSAPVAMRRYLDFSLCSFQAWRRGADLQTEVQKPSLDARAAFNLVKCLLLDRSFLLWTRGSRKFLPCLLFDVVDLRGPGWLRIKCRSTTLYLPTYINPTKSWALLLWMPLADIIMLEETLISKFQYRNQSYSFEISLWISKILQNVAMTAV
jgi:hypothetical protein